MLRWSIASVCMGGALEEKFAAAAKAGFRAVEIFENDLTFFRGKPRDARLMAADLGLEIVALQPLRDFEAMPDPLRAKNFDRAARKLDLMHELGARLLCLCSNVSPDAIDDPERAARDLAELADLARQQGMRIGYEALAWGRWVKDWTAAWDIVRAADRDNLGIVLDSFHICVRGNPIEPIAALPAEKIALVQVADAPALVMDPLSLSRHYRCYPGQGDYPIVDYLDAVTRSGYRGPLSLEIFNDQFRGASAAAIAIDGMRSLRAAGEALAAKRAARGDAAARRPAAASAAAGGRAGRIHRVRGQRRGGERFDRADRGPRLPLRRPASLEGRRPLFAGRDQPRRQPRTRGLRPLVFAVARALGVRDRARRRLGRQGARAGERARVPHLCRQDRTRRSDRARGRRRRGQSHLLRRAQATRRGAKISPRPSRLPPRAACAGSTISPTSCAAANS